MHMLSLTAIRSPSSFSFTLSGKETIALIRAMPLAEVCGRLLHLGVHPASRISGFIQPFRFPNPTTS